MKKTNKILSFVLLFLLIVGIALIVYASWFIPASKAKSANLNVSENHNISNETKESTDTKDENVIITDIKDQKEETPNDSEKNKEDTIENEKINTESQTNVIKEVPTFKEVNETVYATTNVNIRQEPNASANIVGVLKQNENVTRIGIGSNGWDKVKYNNTEAYINHNYLSLQKVVVVIETQTSVEEQKQVTAPAQNTNPDNYLIENVPFIAQKPKYPNGCEAASTTMLLNYYGMNITLTDFINKYLEMNKVYMQNGVRYGPNPETCYAGDPASLHGGWGCFSTAIQNAVNKLINEKYSNKYTVRRNTSNATLPELAKAKKPFLVWTTITYDVVKGEYTWKSYDGKETYRYPKDLHVVVVIGQDDNYYYVNDPLKSYGKTKIAKATLERSFESMGRKAIIIDRK